MVGDHLPYKAKGVDYGHKGGWYLVVGGSIPRDARGRFCNGVGWDHRGGHVALHTANSWALI